MALRLNEVTVLDRWNNNLPAFVALTAFMSLSLLDTNGEDNSEAAANIPLSASSSITTNVRQQVEAFMALTEERLLWEAQFFYCSSQNWSSIEREIVTVVPENLMETLLKRDTQWQRFVVEEGVSSSAHYEQRLRERLTPVFYEYAFRYLDGECFVYEEFY